MRFTVLCETLVLGLALARCHDDRSGPAADAPSIARREMGAGVALATVELRGGRGPLRVALHGGPGLDHTVLRPWLDPLASSAPLLYVDLRGHGRSAPPVDAAGYTLADAAADLAAMLAARDAVADVIAHDFGAAVALELAVRHPERVRRMVLLAPTRGGADLRAKSARALAALGADGALALAALATPQGTLRDPHALAALLRAEGALAWYRVPADDVLARIARDVRFSPSAEEHFRVALSSWDALEQAPEVRAPVLVIAGASDRQSPASDARALADALPHGHYAALPEAAHWPFVEQQATIVQMTERFLRNDGAAE